MYGVSPMTSKLGEGEAGSIRDGSATATRFALENSTLQCMLQQYPIGETDVTARQIEQERRCLTDLSIEVPLADGLVERLGRAPLDEVVGEREDDVRAVPHLAAQSLLGSWKNATQMPAVIGHIAGHSWKNAAQMPAAIVRPTVGVDRRKVVVQQRCLAREVCVSCEPLPLVPPAAATRP